MVIAIGADSVFAELEDIVAAGLGGFAGLAGFAGLEDIVATKMLEGSHRKTQYGITALMKVAL